MRVARLTERGIMVDPSQLHKLGPVDGAIAMIADLLDSEPNYYSVQYKGELAIHLAIDPQQGDIHIQCELPAEGEAKIWEYKDKKITCNKCKMTNDYLGD